MTSTDGVSPGAALLALLLFWDFRNMPSKIVNLYSPIEFVVLRINYRLTAKGGKVDASSRR